MTTTFGQKRKKNGFTQISNTLLEDNRLSWRAKGLLCYMLSRPDNWKINKTDLQKRATEGRDALQSAIDELKEHGFLHIYRKRNNDGRFDYIWEYDDESFVPENQQESGENTQVYRERENRIRLNRQRKTRIHNNTVFNNTDLNNTKDKELKTNMSISPKELESEFESLWKLYPRKIGKKKAFDSFKKARKVKKVPYETIENGLYKYLDYIQANGIEEQFIQHGSTWFNQEKWLDDYVILPKKKKVNSYMDLMDFRGGANYEHGGNTQIIDDYTSSLPY